MQEEVEQDGVLSHRNLAKNATCLDVLIPVGNVALTILPINHVYCLIMDIIKDMYVGYTIALMILLCMCREI